MSFHETGWICGAVYDKQKPAWEQTRFIAYVLSQINSKNKLKPKDVLRFAWDEDMDEDSMNKEDIKQIKEQYKDMLS